jgi:hypothetical protein
MTLPRLLAVTVSFHGIVMLSSFDFPTPYKSVSLKCSKSTTPEEYDHPFDTIAPRNQFCWRYIDADASVY